MIKPSPRDRLAQAAFALFNERGYEQATVDDITERAGVGRTTFFRYYRSKEDVIFPDHDRLLARISERLRAAPHASPLAAISDAVRLVLAHYLDEGDLARRRYELTSAVPALRDREIATVARYQRLFREFIVGQTSDPGERRQDAAPTGQAEPAPLRAELMAASVVAAHNHVLRRWLRGESPDPMRELDDAMRHVSGLFAAVPAPAPPRALPADPDGVGTTIVAFRADADIDAIAGVLRRITQDPAPS
jgi:AcrR family transcriptional regulator